TGVLALGNINDGVQVAGTGNTIGGTTAAARNVVSGNRGAGIAVGGSGTIVQGNYIGTDVSGSVALGNQVNGVRVIGSGGTIGGTAAGAGNVISGNGRNGIEIDAPNNTVQGNLIGTDVGGTRALGNAAVGVLIAFASNNLIGGVG